MAEVTFSAAMGPGRFIQTVTRSLRELVRAGLPAWESSPGGSVHKRQCCYPHPDCLSGCLGDSGLTNTSGYAVQAPPPSLPLTPSQQALVGPMASSHVHLKVVDKLSRHFALALPCLALVADPRWSPQWLGSLLEIAPEGVIWGHCGTTPSPDISVPCQILLDGQCRHHFLSSVGADSLDSNPRTLTSELTLFLDTTPARGGRAPHGYIHRALMVAQDRWASSRLPGSQVLLMSLRGET